MHDRNGTPLKVGDRVLVEARVTDVQADSEYCNVTLQVASPLRQEHMRTIVTNAGSCALLERATEPDVAPPAP